MDAIGIIGVAAGFAALAYFTYKGWHIALSSLLGALIVAVFNGLNITEMYLQSYLPGMGKFLSDYFGQFFFGALLAETYSVTGAGLTVAFGISKACIREHFGLRFKRAMVIFVLTAISAALEFAGVGASLVIMVVYPVALSLYEMVNIPKRYIVAGILGGCLGFANGLPGSPQPGNTVPMKILGTSSTAALVPGIVGAVVQIVVMVLLLSIIIERGIRRGESFSADDVDRVVDMEKKRPAMWVTLVPVALLFVLFNIVKLDINIALCITWLAAVVLFYPYFPNKDIKGMAVGGISQGTVATISICAVIGFSAVVQSTAAYQRIVDSLLSLSMNEYLLIVVCVAFMCMLCGGSATGQAIAVPIVAPVAQKVGISAAAIHRIASFAGATLDTTPYAGTVVMAHAYANVKIRDGYPAVFAVAVIATTVSALAVTAMCALFPGLAA